MIRSREDGTRPGPVDKDFRERACLFKTGMQTPAKVEREMDALRATIKQYDREVSA